MLVRHGPQGPQEAAEILASSTWGRHSCLPLLLFFVWLWRQSVDLAGWKACPTTFLAASRGSVGARSLDGNIFAKNSKCAQLYSRSLCRNDKEMSSLWPCSLGMTQK